MEEIEKARKEQINALENIFSWVGILVMLVGVCVYAGLYSVYVVVYLAPEIVFTLYRIICNAIDYFKARKKFNKLVEQKVREDLIKYVKRILGLKLTTETKAKVLIDDLNLVKKMCEHYIKTKKEEKGE